MSGRLVTGALVATALGVGVVVGLAAPKTVPAGEERSATHANESQFMADIAARDEQISAFANAAAAHRIEGMRVALLITDGTPAETVDQVRAAIEQGGATVEATGQLGTDWWEPSKQSFRGELAIQLSGSMVGVEGLGPTDVMQHAIVQAIAPGAAPRGVEVPVVGPGGVTLDPGVGGVSRQEVLLDVLARANILTLDHPAAAGIEAVVFVTSDGPAGAGDLLNASATVWKLYLGAAEIVVASQMSGAGAATAATIPATGTDAIAAGAATPVSTRPSVVVLSDPKIAAAQIVMALKEQSAGGAGTYGTAASLAFVAIP